MQNCNVKVPAETAWLETDEDIFAMLKAIIGHECMPCGEPLGYAASIGHSSYGPWVEGDIDYMDGGTCYSLHYDFMRVGNVGRVFRYEIDRHPEFGE